MKTLNVFSSALPVFVCFYVNVLAVDTDKCFLPNDTTPKTEEKLLSRISSLAGVTFSVQNEEIAYAVSICGDLPKTHGNVSVTETKLKETSVVLGRRNDTHVTGGDTWILLTYSSGDFFPPNGSQCLGRRRASVFIFCNLDEHEEHPLKLAEIDPCGPKFILPTSALCRNKDELSGTTIFIIIVIVALSVYFIIGILYRRLVHNAQHCQQLPHFSFWSKFGAMCADGCNYVCRCDGEQEDSWNNITSNFDSGDRDDSLLHA